MNAQSAARVQHLSRHAVTKHALTDAGVSLEVHQRASHIKAESSHAEAVISDQSSGWHHDVGWEW